MEEEPSKYIKLIRYVLSPIVLVMIDDSHSAPVAVPAKLLAQRNKKEKWTTALP